MRTTNGSRPGRASARISTRSPLTKPNSRSRRSRAESAREDEPTPTTRPRVPDASAARLTEPDSTAGVTTASMNEIMDENRSHLQSHLMDPTRSIKSMAYKLSEAPNAADGSVGRSTDASVLGQAGG